MAFAVPDLALRGGAVSPAGPLAGERLLPVAPALERLFPEGGLRRGSTVAVAGSTLLALALLAGPSAVGSWCAVVGMPALGLVAAAEVGVAMERLALVPATGSEWPTVVAALLDALDVVVVATGAGAGDADGRRGIGRRVRPADARRLTARARERGAVLVVLGAWEGANVRLSVVGSPCQWQGLGSGHGCLRARLVEVGAEGRGAASGPRRCRLWLPAEGGGVEPA